MKEEEYCERQAVVDLSRRERRNNGSLGEDHGAAHWKKKKRLHLGKRSSSPVKIVKLWEKRKGCAFCSGRVAEPKDLDAKTTLRGREEKKKKKTEEDEKRERETAIPFL